MGCPSVAKLESNLTFSVNTHHPTTEAATDADALPTYRVYEDETSTPILTGTMAKLDDAGTLGFYSATLACLSSLGYEDGKTYTIYVPTIVTGVTHTFSYGFKVEGVVDIAGTGGTPSEVAV